MRVEILLLNDEVDIFEDVEYVNISERDGGDDDIELPESDDEQGYIHIVRRIEDNIDEWHDHSETISLGRVRDIKIDIIED